MKSPPCVGSDDYQCRYAALYSQMSGSKVMVLCCCAVGNVYPISRATDYKPPHEVEYYGTGRKAPHSKFYDGTNKSGFALKPGYDAHWFCVAQPKRGSIVDVECYVPGDERFPPCYDELVVKEEKQVALAMDAVAVLAFFHVVLLI